MFIELIGTSHSELIKPPVINKKNIESYYYLKNQGLLHNSPDYLMELYTKGKIKYDLNKIHQYYEEHKSIENEKINKKLLTEEYICDKYHYNEPKSLNDINEQITVDTYYVDFGASKVDMNDEEFNDQKSIIITNKTNGKIILSWNNNGTENQYFTITPKTCEIPPMKSYSFRIKFLPVCF